MPAAYGARDEEVSPGCDLLVFEDGDDRLPTGYEVKSRRTDGPIAFEWTPRERDACQRAGSTSPDPRWPLARYRVLVVSRLLAQGEAPALVLLDGEECLQGAEPTAFRVRAEAAGSPNGNGQ
ncbi:MAG: hypothetical protein RBU45_22315 [Myxococcota bacterium]|jgi:hypothetical protein|nr:hypothetical protein [Myxococcota bacterium]